MLGSLGRVVSSSSSMFYCSNVSKGIFPKFSFNSGLEFGISSDHAVNMSNNTTQGHGHDTSKRKRRASSSGCFIFKSQSVFVRC